MPIPVDRARRRRPLSALGAILVLAACSSAPTAGSGAASPAAATPGLAQTIHVVEQLTNDTEVKVGSLTGCTNATTCQGDYYLGDHPLVDVSTHDVVGTLKFECFVMDTGSSVYHCPGSTITLTGRGQITFTETVDFDHPAGERGPITGGTGAFLGVTGAVTSAGLGDFTISITR
jgi:hypothetical protein